MIWFAPLLSLLLIALDQWTKHWARAHLQPVGTRPVWEGFFALTYVENRGAAFGLMQGGRWFFVVLTVVVLAGMVYYYIRLPQTGKNWLVRVPMIFVFAGAAGNLIDRAWLGYVTDMFQFTFINFPVFNVADVCLVIGTAALAAVLLFIIRDPDGNITAQ